MLINLSNHPLESWSQKQIEEAEKLYGKIVDLDFPQIPPDADEEIVAVLAKDFRNICLDILTSSKDKNNAVHIMGEMTFCFALVQELKKQKISCIASTAKRDTIQVNEKKTSYFNFVKFRNY